MPSWIQISFRIHEKRVLPKRVSSILIPIDTELSNLAVLRCYYGLDGNESAPLILWLVKQATLMIWLLAISMIVALCASLLLVPVVRSFAHLIGIVDRPDQERKLHEVPVALGGGIAVFLAFAIAFVATLLIDRQFFDRVLGDVTMHGIVLFVSAIAILLVGFVDDVWALRGRQKLLLQCLIIACMVGSGTVIEQIGLFGFDLQLGVFAFPITMVWLLLAVNALNLIDGADGVATTAGIDHLYRIGLFEVFNPVRVWIASLGLRWRVR